MLNLAALSCLLRGPCDRGSPPPPSDAAAHGFPGSHGPPNGGIMRPNGKRTVNRTAVHVIRALISDAGCAGAPGRAACRPATPIGAGSGSADPGRVGPDAGPAPR